jgi:hypothetical protein
MERLLADEPLRRRLGDEAKRRAAAHDVEVSVDRIEAILAELAGRQSAEAA